jgi:hypothetical protein
MREASACQTILQQRSWATSHKEKEHLAGAQDFQSQIQLVYYWIVKITFSIYRHYAHMNKI